MNALRLSLSRLGLAAALAAGTAVGVAAAPAPRPSAAPAAPTTAPAPAEEPVYLYSTKSGDTLISLGRRLLVEPARWPELARANALVNPNRIATGTELRIPLRLMRNTEVPATVLAVIGQAQSGGGALQSGQRLAEGQPISTGADGHVTIRLVDGTLLRLRPDSRLQLRESREIPDARAVRSGARLERGRVEIEAAPARAGRAGFSIDTPQGLLGVRGTEFRVAADAGLTRGEVLGGVVAVSGRSGGEGERVAAGFGSVINGQGQVAAPVPLLPAPDTRALPPLLDKVLLRFPLPALPGAVGYRGQVATDARFDRALADLTSATPELRFGDLPDGDYILRVRAIDAQGFEGRDADHRFRLKARPEAPLPAAPQPKAVSFGSQAEFAWAANDEADHYRLQLAATPDFSVPLRDLSDLRGRNAELEGLQPGTYHWRLASVRASGDQGPWGDARSFELRPLPPAPKAPQVSDDGVSFAWAALPGQTFEFEVATEAGFAQPVLKRRLTQPGIELPLPLPAPGTGRFYVRLRATDPDGFVGPYTAPQHFDIPNCLRDGSGRCVRVGDQTLNLAP